MKRYKLIVRTQLFMGRPVTDDDRRALNCYYEFPVPQVDDHDEEEQIIDKAYEKFCAGRPEFSHTESVELVRIV